MKFKLLILVLVFVSASFASDADQIFADKLIGVWLFEIMDDEVSIKATEEFKIDGTLHSHGKVFQSDKLIEEYKIKSKWEVVDGNSHIEVLESTSTVLKPGTKIKDKIISVDEEEFTFESEDGVRKILKRVK